MTENDISDQVSNVLYILCIDCKPIIILYFVLHK